MSPRKIQLDIESASDAMLAGIVSQLPDYRLVHFLNKKCDVHLSRLNDISIPPSKGKGDPAEYPFFSGINETYGFTACLLPNRFGESQPLIPPLKNIDFLLLLLNHSDRYDQQGMMAQIRSIPGVLMAQAVALDKATGVDRLLGYIEMHLMTRKPT
jgi:hypothetical protein